MGKNGWFGTEHRRIIMVREEKKTRENAVIREPSQGHQYE